MDESTTIGGESNEPSSGNWLAWLVAIGLVGLILSHLGAVPPLETAAASCQQMAYDAAQEAGIPPDLFYKQIYEESGCRNVTSPAGAVGVCQFLPSTAAGLGINPYDPASCLKGAAQMMARYVQEYGDYAKALSAYNCGSGCTNAALAYGATWGCHIPTETQAYIWAIMSEQVCP